MFRFKEMRIKKLLVLFIFIVAIYLRLSNLNLFFFSPHHDIEIIRTVEFLDNHKIPLQGTEIAGSSQARLGPIIHYLYAIPLSISRNPLSVAVFVASLNIIAIFLCYKFCKEFFDENVAIYATALFAVFPLAVFISRFNSSGFDLTPFFTILLFYSIFAFFLQQKSKYFILVTLSLGILLQLYPSNFTLIFILFFLFLLLRPKFEKKYFLLGLFVFLSLYSPYIYHECITQFSSTRAILGIKNKFSFPNFYAVKTAFDSSYLSLNSKFEIEMLEGFIYTIDEHFPEKIPIINFLSTLSKIQLFLFCTALIYLLFTTLPKLKRGDKVDIKNIILLCWFFIPVMLGMGIKTNASFPLRYLYSLYPVHFIIIAIFLSRLIRFGKIAQIIVIALLNVIIFSHFYFLFLYFNIMNNPNTIPFLGFLGDRPTTGFSLGDEMRILEYLVKNFNINETFFRQNLHGLMLNKIKKISRYYDKVNYLFTYTRKKYISSKEPFNLHHYMVEEGKIPVEKIDAVSTFKIKKYVIISYVPLINYTTIKYSPHEKPEWYKELRGENLEYMKFEPKEGFYRLLLYASTPADILLFVNIEKCIKIDGFYVNGKSLLGLEKEIYKDSEKWPLTIREFYYNLHNLTKPGENLIAFKIGRNECQDKYGYIDIFAISTKKIK
jgi:hypothetical protein